VTIDRPDPPVVGKVTHHSLELTWQHVKEKLNPNERFRYTLQEGNSKNKQEWCNVYSGYGIVHVMESLEPNTEYRYRLCVINKTNERSEYSPICVVKTTKEPLTGEALQKAIILDRKDDVEKILDSPEGPKICEIPDKFGNLPLMIAANRNNLE
jgi:fibronectin type 3 and ankyrin repeat domains protein 1